MPANESQAGASQIGLGIDGSDDQGNGIVLGAPLDGDSIAHHMFVSNVSAKASVALLGNIGATATLGIVGISISGGTAAGTASVTLQPPGTAPGSGRIDLADVFSVASGLTAPTAPATLDLSGDALFDLVIDGQPFHIDVPAGNYATLVDLVAAVNGALAAKGAGQLATAIINGGSIELTTASNDGVAHEFTVRASATDTATPPTLTNLGFDAAPQSTTSPSQSFPATPNWCCRQLTSSVLSVPANTPLTTLTVDWPDITDSSTLSLTDDGQGILPAFEHLAAKTVTTAAQSVADDFIAKLASPAIAQVANVKLPLVNKTIADLFQIRDNFTQQLSQLANGTIDQIVAQLEKLLGGAATVSFDTSGASVATPGAGFNGAHRIEHHTEIAQVSLHLQPCRA